MVPLLLLLSSPVAFELASLGARLALPRRVPTPICDAAASTQPVVGGPFGALAQAVTASKAGALNQALIDAPDKEMVLEVFEQKSSAMHGPQCC